MNRSSSARRDRAAPAQDPMSRFLLRAYRATDAVFVDGLAKAGFSGVAAAQWEVLARVGPEGSRAARIARELGMSKQAVAQTLHRLERAGYLERRPDPSDRRARTVHLTARGRALRGAGSNASDAFDERLRTALGRTRVKALRATLEELTRALERT